MAFKVQLDHKDHRVRLVQMAPMARKGQREYEGQLVHKAKQVLKVQLAKEVQGHSQTWSINRLFVRRMKHPTTRIFTRKIL
jgi:hypothetical protein